MQVWVEDGQLYLQIRNVYGVFWIGVWDKKVSDIKDYVFLKSSSTSNVNVIKFDSFIVFYNL